MSHLNRRGLIKAGLFTLTTAAVLKTPLRVLADAASDRQEGDISATGCIGGGSKADISGIGAPPLGTNQRQAFIDYMMERSRPGDTDRAMLGARFDRYIRLVGNSDLTNDASKKAFLLSPRHIFALDRNASRAYEHAFLDIGWGVTISGPHIVGRMTNDLQLTDGLKVMEIGTGSGYQASLLAYLTRNVYSVEIIRPLAQRTSQTYRRLAQDGYPEFGNICTKAADGYYGWEENAPYDKIIVTAGVDHVPPHLLEQLAVGGSLVIPVGPSGAQTLLNITKENIDGIVSITRRDVYNGRRKVSFVPFTSVSGAAHRE